MANPFDAAVSGADEDIVAGYGGMKRLGCEEGMRARRIEAKNPSGQLPKKV